MRYVSKRQVSLLTQLGLGALILSGVSLPVQAQLELTPDTAGDRTTRTTVNPFTPQVDIIRGGERPENGINLFHSFEAFNVGENRGVYFEAPNGVENVFSRITGTDPSDILGTLGVIDPALNFDDANLFLINPNGILFGPNASLDVTGSFIATTADAVEFGENASFSASDPGSSTLLSVNPSALFFNAANEGIVNRSVATQTIAGTPSFGLRAGRGRSLLLVSGDIVLDGGRIGMLDGRIELGAIAGRGRVELTFDANQFRLVVPETLARADIRLSQSAVIDILGTANLATGALRLFGDDIILLGRSNVTTNAGNGIGAEIFADARTLTLRGGSQFRTATGGASDSGNIRLDILESINLSGQSPDGQIPTAIGSESERTATGDAGNVAVSTHRMGIQAGAFITSSTFGSGRGGTLSVTARGSETNPGSILISGTRVDNAGVTRTSELQASTSGSGAAGRIVVDTDQLRLNNGAQIQTSTFGMGRGGNIAITADLVDLVGQSNDRQVPTSIGSESRATATGDAGDVSVFTNRLTLRGGALITSSTFGSGRGGTLSVTARGSETNPGSILIRGARTNSQERVFSSELLAGTSGTGAAGRLIVNVDQLYLREGGQITTSTFNAGQGGALTIRTDSIDLVGQAVNRRRPTAIASESTAAATGNAGDVNIFANRITLREGGFITSSTFGSGRGGTLSVTARDPVTAAGSITISGTHVNSAGILLSSGLLASTSGSGAAGRLFVNADQLRISRGGQIQTSAFGSGQGGTLQITADFIDLVGQSSDRSRSTAIASESVSANTGRAQDITILTHQLAIRGGAAITSSTFGSGSGGNLLITARESGATPGTILLRGIRIDSTGQIRNSSLLATTSALERGGQAGNINLRAGRLLFQDGGEILASTAGSGQAGNITIRADVIDIFDDIESDRLIRSGFGSEVLPTATNNGGDLDIFSRRLHIRGGSFISTRTFGQGNAGDIRLIIEDVLAFDNGSSITSSVRAGGVGDSGNIDIQARSITLDSGSQIGAVVSRQTRINERFLQGGRGNGGDIQIFASDSIRLSGFGTRGFSRGFSSGLLTLSERGASGTAGNITVRAGDFQVENGAVVVASTFNSGDGGDIEIRANRFEATNGGQVVTNTRSSGNAGQITLIVAGDTQIAGIDPNFSQRQELVEEYLRLFEPSANLNDVVVNVIDDRSPTRQVVPSGIFANTENTSSGTGGTVELSSANLSLSDRALISAQSQGSGTAGNLTLNVSDRLELLDSDFITAAPNASGGDILVNAQESNGEVRLGDRGLVLLQGDSDITTDSSGDGGNIAIGGIGVIAFDDSDIISRSSEARGGDITLSTFFSETNPPGNAESFDGNNQVDVNAEGALESGQIVTTDTTTVQNSLVDLPDTSVNVDQILASSCIVRSQDGTFLITGTGGLPQRPGDTVVPSYPTGEVRPIPQEAGNLAIQWWNLKTSISLQMGEWC
jgi:filamentous hemagglutinin family protein